MLTLNDIFVRFEDGSIVISKLPVIDPNMELFSWNMVYNVLSHVGVGKSSGPENISAHLDKTVRLPSISHVHLV